MNTTPKPKATKNNNGELVGPPPPPPPLGGADDVAAGGAGAVGCGDGVVVEDIVNPFRN